MDIWIADLDTLPGRDELLSRDESARAARFHFERDRHRFSRCRGLLRELIAQWTGRDAASLLFHYNDYGKPELEGLHFNVSHCANLAVIALSRDTPVGIDVEAINEDADVMALARTAFSPAECAELSAMPAGQRVAAFFRGWTRKEAYLKLLGTGFSRPSDSFTVSLTEAPLTPPAGCALRDVEVPPGFVCAMATPREVPAPRVRRV